MPAGTVIVVLAIALGLGWLFNAQGIQKTAQTQSPGFRRDVGVFFADRIEDLSSVFQLDRPREWIQDAAGREGDDDINLELPDPVISGDSQAGDDPTATTLPIEKPRFTPSKPARTWVGGDSLSFVPGQSIISSFPGAAGGAISMVSDQVDYEISTGLSRPDVRNWPQYITDSVLPQDPDILIFTVGPNDDQNLRMPDGGFLCCFGDQGWQDEYRRRVGGMMDLVTADSDRIMVWIGNPIHADGARSDKYALINEIYKTEAAKRPGKVVYVDIYSLFQGPDGGFADYLPNSSGELVKVRADEVHLTPAGGDRVSEAVFAALSEAVRFRPDPAPGGGGNGTGNGGGGQ
jgi:hypothetical protein